MKKKPMKPMKAPETKTVVTTANISIPVETVETVLEETAVQADCSCEEECSCEECAEECIAEENCEDCSTCDTEANSNITAEIIIQYQGKEFTKEQMIDAVKADWCLKENEEEIKNINLYFKPEDSKIYYVVNDIHTGDVDI